MSSEAATKLKVIQTYTIERPLLRAGERYTITADDGTQIFAHRPARFLRLIAVWISGIVLFFVFGMILGAIVGNAGASSAIGFVISAVSTVLYILILRPRPDLRFFSDPSCKKPIGMTRKQFRYFPEWRREYLIQFTGLPDATAQDAYWTSAAPHPRWQLGTENNPAVFAVQFHSRALVENSFAEGAGSSAHGFAFVFCSPDSKTLFAECEQDSLDLSSRLSVRIYGGANGGANGGAIDHRWILAMVLLLDRGFDARHKRYDSIPLLPQLENYID